MLSSSNVSNGEGTNREKEADWYIGEEAFNRDEGVWNLCGDGDGLLCGVLSGIFNP